MDPEAESCKFPTQQDSLAGMSGVKEPKAQPIANGGSRNGEKPKRGRRSAERYVLDLRHPEYSAL
jgi:hypothetical protein